MKTSRPEEQMRFSPLVCSVFCIIFVPLWLSLAGCDDGRIHEETVIRPQEGVTLKLTARISGMKSWPEKYNVVVAGFGANGDYAVLSKVLPQSAADGQEITLYLSGIGQEVATLELCVVNRLRKRIVSYYSIDATAAAADTLCLDAGSVDVEMYSTIQRRVFNENCVACHGRSTSAAAGLYLTEGRSYAALVGRRSAVDSTQLLVAPGRAQESFLHTVLNRNGVIRHDHGDILSAKPSLLTLLDDWMDQLEDDDEME
ncbi:MAG: hypothetical protein ACI37U_01425 [Bacteroides sp.]